MLFVDDAFGRRSPVFDNEILVDTIRQARNEVDKAINNTLRDLFDHTNPRTPQDLLAILR